MNSQPSVAEVLDTVDRLKDAAQEFARRRQEIDQSHRRSTARELKRHEAALEQAAGEAARLEQEAESNLRRDLDRLDARHDARRRRIEEAHRRSRETAVERIEQDEGRVKYQVQKGQLDAERSRTRRLAENDAALASLQESLAEAQEHQEWMELDAYHAFRGYPGLRRQLHQEVQADETPSGQEGQALLASLQHLQAEVEQDLRRFRKLPLAALFRFMPAWLLAVAILLVHATLAFAHPWLPIEGVPPPTAAVSCALLLLLLGALFLLGKRRATPRAAAIADGLARARVLHALALESAQAHHQQQAEQIRTETEDHLAQLKQAWDQAVAEAAARRNSWPELMEEKGSRAAARHEQRHRERRERIESRRAEALRELQQRAEARRAELKREHEERMRELRQEQASRLRALEEAWHEETGPLAKAIAQADAEARKAFPPWSQEFADQWSPPAAFDPAIRFGRLKLQKEAFLAGIPEEQRLEWPGPDPLTAPLLLTYPDHGSLLLETSGPGTQEAANCLNNVILRLFSKSPPGRLKVTIIDPVGLGQNFAGIMHLADHEETLINHRIWTQMAEIEQRLADLNEQMEKVIQMYLRNEYQTIAEYNEKAGSIAEKYHFLVVADFPVHFSETAIRRLLNIAASGARCGVYTLMHWDRRQDPASPVVLDDLREQSLCLKHDGTRFVPPTRNLPGLTLELDPPPPPDIATRFLNRVGLSSVDSSRVEVPFEQVAPGPEAVWSEETAAELRVPIGRTGATKLQYLALGKGTRQHALVAGKTGSGKSTLFHVIITNLSLWCSPDQVEFYLVDFKKGVEFKCYAAAQLPHARVVAIESDREFGLSVLQRVDEELRRRGDLFRSLGVQDLAGYQRSRPDEPMPRSLLLVDEFQELFIEDDRIAQDAAVLLDRIVRQGRAFGIHVVLGSQTLGGAYTLARTTIGQMVVRIALQCNEADAYLIMDDNNPAPRLLSRPGEGIYNDMAGAIEGNSPFQAVWLPDEERDRRLRSVREKAEQHPQDFPTPFVFEGNAPADVRDNEPLNQLLQSTPDQAPSEARIWLGSPNRIKGPTEAVFRPQAGQHLLLVGQRDEAILSILSTGLMALDRQFPPERLRLCLLDSSPPDSSPRHYLESLAGKLRHPLRIARGGEIEALLGELGQDLHRRSDEGAEAAPTTFLFVMGLQNFKKLRHEEDFGLGLEEEKAAPKPDTLFHELVTGGAARGLHLVVSCDTYNNVTRFLGRKGLAEFEMRVLFQMSANDSASLIDSPKAGSLGLHRALFYNEHEGYLETFRPYALPDW